MLGTMGAMVLLGYLPGALLYRLPFWHRDRRAALAAEERVFWHVMLSVSWSLTLVLVLAALDLYRFDRLLTITGGFAIGLVVTSRGWLRYQGTAARVTWTALLPLLLIGLALWRFFPVSEYIIGGRDPGVYVTEGIQIAQRGALVIADPVVAGVPAFARELFFPRYYGQDDYESVRFMGMFVRDTGAGTVVGQFPHLFPASIAIGYGLTGLSGARDAVAWWGVLGVLAVYFAAVRFVGRGAAFAAAALLTLHVIQIWFSRYPNTDIVMQAGVFAGLLAFARAHQDDDGFFGPVAAWVLGLQLFSRVDALLAILVCSGVVVLRWAMSPGLRLQSRFLAPVLIMTGLGLWYLTGLMQAYFWRAAIFLRHLPAAELWTAVAGGGLLLAVAVWLRTRRTTTLQEWFPVGVVVPLIGLALYAYFLREPGGKLTDYDAYALRNYVDLYLWWPMFALALVGLGLYARRDFWRDPALILTFAAFSLFLLYKLKIVPEHLWLSRRFLAVILPGSLMLACAAALGTRLPVWRSWTVVRPLAGVLMLVLAAQQYMTASAPILPHVEYRNIIPYMETLAEQFGPRDLAILEARDTGSDVHVLGLPLAYIYARPVLVLASARPDPLLFREFLTDALARYDRVFYVGTGGTTLLSRHLVATPVVSDRVQVDEFEVTTERLPTEIRRKEFDYGIYALTIGAQPVGPFVLDVGDRDDLHVLRLHAKEATEGRMIRWTQRGSEIAVTGMNGSEREVVLTMNDGGRPAAAPQARVEVYFNGTHLGGTDVGSGFQDYRFALPAALAEAAARSDAPATLRLESTVWSPLVFLQVPDGRDLGVMLDRVTVR